MDCREFDRWLDEGSPASARVEAAGHAESCRRCAAEHAAATTLSHVLAQRFATTGNDFTDRVMQRIELGLRPIVVPPSVDLVLPWWLRVLQEPATMLACVLAVGLIGWTRPLAHFVRAGLAAAGEATAGLAWAEWAEPTTLALAVLGFVPLLAAVSWALYRLSVDWGTGPRP